MSAAVFMLICWLGFRRVDLYRDGIIADAPPVHYGKLKGRWEYRGR